MRFFFAMCLLILVNLVFSDVILTEDFESDVIDSDSWVMSGDADWLIDSNTFFSGSGCACSGDIIENQSTTISTVIDIPVGNESKISFYKKISTESDYDFLNIYINDIKIDELSYLSGESDWSISEYSFNTTASIETTFKFEYIKDGSVDDGSDQVWIDDIEITSSDTKSPDFSFSSGYYPNSETLYLTSIYSDATIYYTTDGSEPDMSSTVYNAATGNPFGVFTDFVTIKAILYLPGDEISLVKSNTYYFNNILSGAISGILSNPIYYVNGDLIIESGNSLTIEPGVSVLFNGNYCIYVNGQFLAVGNETERINFTVTDFNQGLFDDETTAEGGWGGIVFQDIASGNNFSIIDYCDLSYGKSIYREGGCIFINNASNIKISNSTITKSKTRWDGGGIFIQNSNSIIIRDNIISSNKAITQRGGGIYNNTSNSDIQGNFILNNSATNYGGGLYCKGSDISISNNVFDSNYLTTDAASNGGGIYFYDGTATFTNNTISNNTSIRGSGLYYNSPYYSQKLKLYNNLIYNNKSIEGFVESDDDPQNCISLNG
ncbi:MAG: chitobiase/beta-hexosaminidase C-terminal domain-containing protein, partial [Candidatus Delongbacteria bacterium]|nr:chitobiase/beta-hexosaminidase C-terminal domain-containing protein [Candidatus Delongbacteria bacterium]